MVARGFLDLIVAFLVSSGLWSRPALAQGEVPRAPVEISFAFRTPSKLPVKGSLLLRPEENGETLRLAISSPELLSLTLPAGSKWEVSADLPGFWVRRKPLVVGPSDQPSRLSLDLWPLGTISGVVRVK